VQGIDIGVRITKQSKLHAVVRRQIGRRLDDLTRRDTTCVLLLRECAALNIQCRASILPEELQSASQTRRLLHPGQPPKSNAHGYGVRGVGVHFASVQSVFGALGSSRAGPSRLTDFRGLTLAIPYLEC